MCGVSEEIVLGADEAPKKLENYLKKRFPIGFVRKLFRRNGIRLNGKHPSPDDLIRPGDRIRLYFSFAEKTPGVKAAPPPSARLNVIDEDDRLLVVDKPPDLAVQEGRQVRKRDSVIGILQARYRERGIAPVLVHRLDRDTSGVLLLAKDEQTARQLEESFARGSVVKDYLCLLAGRIPEERGTIDFWLPGRDHSPAPALTRFKVEKRFAETTLARVRIETGRMHQIRLHFARLGHPVVMDDQHGDFAFNKRFRKTYGLKRQFLHACNLALEYGGRKRTWTSPLPEDLKRTLELLDRTLAHDRRGGRRA